MAAPEDQSETGGGESAGPEACSPCRGTGKVISQLGGKREEITCPWCEGGGVRIPEHDAQAHFKGEGGEWAAAAAASAAAEAEASPAEDPPPPEAA